MEEACVFTLIKKLMIFVKWIEMDTEEKKEDEKNQDDWAVARCIHCDAKRITFWIENNFSILDHKISIILILIKWSFVHWIENTCCVCQVHDHHKTVWSVRRWVHWHGPGYFFKCSLWILLKSYKNRCAS